MKRSPDAVRELLFDAIARGDEPALERLCNRHRKAIVEGFGDWRAPQSALADRAAAETWALSMIAIAQCMGRQGDMQPLESMLGGPRDNPLRQWQDAYRRAQALNAAGEYDASNRILDDIVADMTGSIGPGVDDIHAKVHGLAGLNWMRLGDLERACRCTHQARDECRKLGDDAGVRIYEEHLRALEAATQAARAGLRERTIRAQRLSDAARYTDSNRLLQILVEDLKRSDVTEADLYRGKVYGLFGLNHARLGDVAAAERWTRLAHDECERVGDTFGTRIYSANLRAISRPESHAQEP